MKRTVRVARRHATREPAQVTDGIIALPPPVRASNISLNSIAVTHDRVRAILGSHLWKLGFVTEEIDVPTEAGPCPDARWEVRVVARRRRALRGRRPERRGGDERLLLDVPCRVRRRLFGRVDVHYELPIGGTAAVHRLTTAPRRAHG